MLRATNLVDLSSWTILILKRIGLSGMANRMAGLMDSLARN